MFQHFFMFFIFLFTNETNTYAQDFEGKISFEKQSTTDTLYYQYYVKGDKIRFEELNRNRKVIKYSIIDFKNFKMFDINPDRKIFMPVSIQPYTAPKVEDLEIIKSENFQVINGYKCHQWRVINRTKNTDIQYWVTKDNFLFFNELIRIVNRTDKNTLYYLQIPDNIGYLPMLSVERSLLREFRMQLTVTEIKKENLDVSMFELPKGYTIFQH